MKTAPPAGCRSAGREFALSGIFAASKDTQNKDEARPVRREIVPEIHVGEPWLMAKRAQRNLSVIGVPERFLKKFRPPVSC
jgi:hypothetical protein